MARGNNVSIPSGSGSLQRTLYAERQTILVLNPNNGVLYVKINSSSDPTTWDWIVPSQSRAYLPGPWLEYGLYYVDQSGAGVTGNITVYETDQRFDVPDYAAIGVARLAQQTSMDISEGSQPANPGAGILRLWADTNEHLDLVRSSGSVSQVIDAGITLGGVLSGSLPNPGMAPGAASANVGALAGDLSGNLPSPTIASGVVSTTKLALGAAHAVANNVALSGSGTTSATFVAVSPAISVSLTTLGYPVLVLIMAAARNSIAGTVNYIGVAMDGGAVTTTTVFHAPAANYIVQCTGFAYFTPAAGSHTFSVYFAQTGGGTINLDTNEYTTLYAIEFRKS